LDDVGLIKSALGYGFLNRPAGLIRF